MVEGRGEKSLLITGSRVYTGDPAAPWAEAVLTRGNLIQYVGTEAEARGAAGSSVEEISIPGGLVLAGLNDSHVHMTMGSYNLTTLNLEGAVTPAEVQARLREYARRNPDREWIEGWGAFYEAFEGLGRPEREMLDEAVSDRPVYIRAFDSHSAWCNTEALRRAGIEHGAGIPRPNEVVVDSATGLASGMLKEKLATNLVARCLREPTQTEKDHMLCNAMRYVNRLGVTSVQNMDGDLDRLQQYQGLLESGDLSLRAYHYMSVREETPREYLQEVLEYTRQYNSVWNRTCGIKLFIDGVVEAKTAWMLEPYADGSGDIGVPDMDPDVYREFVIAADALDMDVATHAIGDRGIRTAIDAYEAAQKANGGRRDRRHRVEHIEVGNPVDLPRLGRLGITASMQPLHAAPTTDPSTTPWTKLVGPEREPYSFAWRRLLETGARLSFGSDWPVVTIDTRPGIHTAITRTNISGEPAGGWQPQLNITLAQALDAYTSGAAYAERQEHLKGTLRPGMLADITAFAQNPFALAPDEILDLEVALTVVDGRAVHRTL